MFCHKCGTQLTDGAKFCHKCGTQMLSEKEAQLLTEESAVNNTNVQQSGEKTFSRFQDDSIHSIKENIPLKRNSKKLSVLIGLAVLIFIVAFTIVTVGKKTDDKKYTKEQKEDSGFQEKIDLSETFIDQETGITFQYPAEWMVLDSSGEFRIVEMIDSGNTPDHIASFNAIMDSYTVNTAISEQLQEDIFGFETDYREEYIDKIRELFAKDESIQFALIDLIDNGVPELVAGHFGYDVSVFTCVDEGIVALMDQWPYGAMGNMGYEYLPGQNVIRNYNMESAGAIVYESYMKVDNSYEIVDVYDEDISIRYIKDTNADGIVDGEDEYSDDPIYYYGETEISEEEYKSYQIAGEYEQIEGSMSADTIIDILREDDEVTEMPLEDSMAPIEDYYRLSGIYSDSMGEANLSLSIYTSQEEGETTIGTATLYTDDEEIYLGEICLLEEGVYKIEMETGDEIILKESEDEDVIVLQLYGNGEYLDDCRMIEHYEP